MNELQGKGIARGVAVGRIFYYKKSGRQIRRTYREDSEAEWKRFVEAREKAEDQLQNLKEKAVKETGEEAAEIFEAHRMLLRDDELETFIREIIPNAKVSAEYAV